jgi:hypothetical protein
MRRSEAETQTTASCNKVQNSVTQLTCEDGRQTGVIL